MRLFLLRRGSSYKHKKWRRNHFLDVLGLGLLSFCCFATTFFFQSPSVTSFQLCGMSSFFAWTYGPRRKLFENNVVHPFSFVISFPQTFCPQLHRTRPRLRLKSLAWARHHRERLTMSPRTNAKLLVSTFAWRESALVNPWGDLWDSTPYDHWGGHNAHWYQQRYQLNTFDAFDGFDFFCGSLNPLHYFRFAKETMDIYKQVLLNSLHAILL